MKLVTIIVGIIVSLTSPVAAATTTAPPPDGYFTLNTTHTLAGLPSQATCASLVHRSSWEPRPSNAKQNQTMPNVTKVHNSFASRPRAVQGAYDSRWDSKLLPRVTGHFTGTTDEIIQWAACKWGLPDNVLRAQAVRESTWYEYRTNPDGTCVWNFGCGDAFVDGKPGETYDARKTFCDGLASFGYDYQIEPRFGDGYCPKTFSIVGIMAWWNPNWGPMSGNQNGTFPFSKNSTAFALDYLASNLRGCYNGWQWELGASYAAGDLWGCVGAWYSGSWHDAAGDAYASRVQTEIANHTWLQTGF